MHKATSKTIIKLGGLIMERRLLEGLVENEDFLQEFSILNGLLLKGKDPAIYFIMEGQKCLIPNWETFKNLFVGGDHIVNLNDKHPNMWEKFIAKIPNGEVISDGAILIKKKNQDAVYMLTNLQKHWIVSPSVFNACSFNWDKIQKYPDIIIDSIPNGFNINYEP